jgi:zinc D-Ala-D-Ala carboxypeptidase
MEKHNNLYWQKDRNLLPQRKIKFFTLGEFDSPDKIGSGENMNLDFVRKLDEARELAGVPFKINSGFRTKEHNVYLEKKGYHVAKNSSHLKGLAADISTKDSKTRFLIVDSLIKVGFTRIGIGKTFVHVDSDVTKSQSVLWMYY